MSGKGLLAIALASTLGGYAVLASADDMTPRPQREFTEKPRIEDYADYNAFLVDIMEYRRQKESASSRPKPAPTAAAPIAAPAATPSQPRVTIDSSGRVVTAVDPKLYQIDGPETLDQALQRARQLPHPFYPQAERFGRSTSFSFPLPPMDGDDMSQSEVEGKLQDLDSLRVEVYEDETAPALAESVNSDNPSNEDETRNKQAFSATNGITSSSLDLNARVAVDTDGRRYDLPLVLKNEVDYTVIRLTNLTVETR